MVPRLQLLAAALLFSTAGAAIKSSSLTSWQIAGLRSGVAALALLAFIPAARRNWTWRMAAVALCYASTMVAFVNANKLTTSANAIFLQSTNPLYLCIAAPIFLGERLKRSDLLIVFFIAAGLALFVSADQTASSTAPDPARGNIFGLISGITYALTLGGLRLLQKNSREGEDPGIATVALGNIFACVACIPMLGALGRPGAIDWAVVLYLGVIQIGLAYILLTRGMKKVPALEASLLLLAEPAMNPVWSGIIHSEWPSKIAALGGALILGAALLQALISRR